MASESRSFLWGSKFQNTIARVKSVLAVLSLLVPAAVCAQPLNVYSEFAQVDKAGRVTAPETPREILSPGIVRNAYTSFQVVVEAAPDAHWRLFVGQNPENAVRVTMYRENGGALEPIELPAEGDGTQVFWMDLWTDRNAPVARIKVEPELYLKEDWFTYPMEARVMEARVPDGVQSQPGMKTYLCGDPPSAAPDSDISRFRSRNAQQDVALSALASKDDLRKLYGPCEALLPENPEWYLRIRDYLFRLR
jgi:hypothetical protein